MRLVAGLSERSRKEQLAAALRERALRRERARLQASFMEFFKAAWPAMDTSVYCHGWHLEAIAEHLEAVARGQIRKLLVNVPPRHSKTLLASVAWPAWLWAQDYDPDLPLMGAQAKVLCLSYSDQLVLDNAVAARRLIESEWYRELWGDKVVVTRDQSAKNRFDLTAGGSRISASFGGTVTGRGGDIKIIDDPIKAEEGNSEAVRNKVISLYDGTLKSRITDPRHSAEVVIMQRVHDLDLSGHILGEDRDFVHLCLPAEYEASRHCVTVLGWEDPRSEEGDLLWPERFGPKELAPYKRNIYDWAGQWQQRPAPRGGGIFREEWWQTYEVPPSRLYDFGPDGPVFVLASLDTAFKEKQENDYSALTVWVVYDDPKSKQRRIVLVDAWKKRLPLHGVHVPRGQNETQKDYMRRSMPKWGLTEWVVHTCTRRKVTRLIVEDSARGHDVNAEIRRLHGARTWGIHLIPAKGDKVARAHSVVDLFTDQMIFAPGEWICSGHGVPHCPQCPDDGMTWAWRDWANMVVTDMSVFPKGAHDDIVDSACHALKHLRDIGLAIRRDERQLAEEMLARERPKQAVGAAYFA